MMKGDGFYNSKTIMYRCQVGTTGEFNINDKRILKRSFSYIG